MSLWICTEVLRRDTVAGRALVIENFVCIAWHCFKHHDMHSVMTITLALSSSCIKRLSKTWDAIEKKVNTARIVNAQIMKYTSNGIVLCL